LGAENMKEKITKLKYKRIIGKCPCCGIINKRALPIKAALPLHCNCTAVINEDNKCEIHKK